jgi:hypothetical protein
MQAELQSLKQSFRNEEGRLLSLRASASPASIGGIPSTSRATTPCPEPRSGLHLNPHATPTHELLLATTDDEKRAWLDRHAALIRACDEANSVRARLHVAGHRVNLHLDIVPTALMESDRLQRSLRSMRGMQGHLHSLSDFMQGAMAIAHNELVAGGSSVSRLTGGGGSPDGQSTCGPEGQLSLSTIESTHSQSLINQYQALWKLLETLESPCPDAMHAQVRYPLCRARLFVDDWNGSDVSREAKGVNLLTTCHICNSSLQARCASSLCLAGPCYQS